MSFGYIYILSHHIYSLSYNNKTQASKLNLRAPCSPPMLIRTYNELGDDSLSFLHKMIDAYVEAGFLNQWKDKFEVTGGPFVEPMHGVPFLGGIYAYGEFPLFKPYCVNHGQNCQWQVYPAFPIYEWKWRIAHDGKNLTYKVDKSFKTPT